MLHRLQKLQRNSRLEEPRIGIISLWDVENNAVRILAATLRHAGYKVVEIYFKDWISNSLDPADDPQLENLARILRREELNLACLSIRASAYAHQANIITEFLHNELEIPVLWGGMHPTMAPDECIQKTDMILKGEGELALLDFINNLKHSKSLDDVLGSKNVWFRKDSENVVQNSLRPLVQNLDDLQFRDYTSHEDKYFIHNNSYMVGDPMHGDPVFR